MNGFVYKMRKNLQFLKRPQSDPQITCFVRNLKILSITTYNEVTQPILIFERLKQRNLSIFALKMT